jgi:hypothetical protein
MNELMPVPVPRQAELERIAEQKSKSMVGVHPIVNTTLKSCPLWWGTHFLFYAGFYNAEILPYII